MKFDRYYNNTDIGKVKVIIDTVDTNLEYEREMTPSEATEFINKLTHDKWVSRTDNDNGAVYYINTKHIISINVDNI